MNLNLSPRELDQLFPKLLSTGYQKTSRSTARYNCIAWAAGDWFAWWDPQRYWPKSVPRSVYQDGLIRLFEHLGYERCTSAEVEPGYEKVALYGNRHGRWTHAARQLSDGNWTSKLGKSFDISHYADGLTGGDYGAVYAYLRRRKSLGARARVWMIRLRTLTTVLMSSLMAKVL